MSSPFPQLAAELGVPLHGGDPFLPAIPILNWIKRPHYVEGEFRGRHLKIFNFTKGSGKNSKAYHAVSVVLNRPTGLTFQLSVEGFFSKIGKAVGMQDLETGNPRFDDAFILKSNDNGFIQGAFLPEIQQEFVDIKERWPKRFGSISLNGASLFQRADNDTLHYSQPGHLRRDEDRQRAAALATAMNDLADAIEAYATL